MKNNCFLLLILICLISCKKNESKNKSEEPLNKFLGVWNDTEYIIPNETKLKINSDNTFVYTAAGCDWRVFSRGNWKTKGDSVELTSIKIDTCYIAFPFIDCGFYERKDKKRMVTVPNCEPDTGGSFCVFTKEVFYIKNDSLIYKIKDSKCSDSLRIEFAKTPKIRKHRN
ncbi:hypothetical protein [Flavobacterium panacis]|uniref:hypothetical protein n=1 Tax=Flavobacterium panacis TaxID=2962567 RepID=UPI00214F0D0E|nr:hypothetical protein [Flavobacterium panacis]MCR4033768.1 hypothetical protein [Flavobacterium panacis]